MSLYPSLRNIGEGERTNKYEQTKSEISVKRNTNEALYPSIPEFKCLEVSDHENTTKANNSKAGSKTHLVKLKKCSKYPKFGLIVSAVNNGIYVCFVLKDSQAAKAGLRFGEQILSIDDKPLDGFTADQVHNMLKKIKDHETVVFKIGQKPLETRVTVEKDEKGHIGLEILDGKIHTVFKDSPAAKSGIKENQRLLEINGKTVLGMCHKEVISLIQKSGKTMNLVTMPMDTFKVMMSPISPTYVRKNFDQSIHSDSIYDESKCT